LNGKLNYKPSTFYVLVHRGQGLRFHSSTILFYLKKTPNLKSERLDMDPSNNHGCPNCI